MFQEIANSDILNLAFFLQLDEGLPGLQPDVLVFLVFRLQLRDARPVDQDEIKIGAVQLLDDGQHGLPRLLSPLLSRTDLTRDIQLLPPNPRLLNRLPNLLLIPINTRRINMRVATLKSRLSADHAVLLPQLVRPVADHRDLVPCEQGDCGLEGQF